MRVFVYLGFTMLIGMTVALFTGITPCIMAAVLCITVACILIITKNKIGNRKIIISLCLIACALLIQSVISYFTFDISSLNNTTHTFEATVKKSKVTTSQRNYMVASTEKVDGKNLKLDIYIFSDAGYSAYDKISGKGLFKTKTYENSKPLISVTTSEPVIKTGSNHGIGYYLSLLRNNVIQTTRGYIKNTAYPIFTGMVLGDTGLIDSTTSRTFSRCGISHIFSVSGLHIAILNGVILFIFSLFGLSHKKQTVLSIIILIFLAMFVGISQSVLRSVLMILIFNIAAFLSRRSDSLNSLGFSVFIMLILDSQSVQDVSFLLTVMATFGIVLLSPKLSKMVPTKTPLVLQPFLQSGIISVCAFIGTLPVVLIYFDELSLIGILVNVIMAPVFTILLPICFLVSIMAPLDFLFPITAFLGNICTMLISFIQFTCDIFSKIPFAFVPLGFNFLKIYYIIILGVVVLQYLLKNKIPYTRPIAVLLSIIIFLTGAVIHRGQQNKNTYIYPISELHTKGAIISSYNCKILILFSFQNSSDYELTSELYSYGIDNIDLLVSYQKNNKSITTVTNNINIKRIAILDKHTPDISVPISSTTDFRVNSTYNCIVTSNDNRIIFTADENSYENTQNKIYINKDSEYSTVTITDETIKIN